MRTRTPAWKSIPVGGQRRSGSNESVERGEAGVTSRNLSDIVSRVAAGSKLIVVSNREPYLHERVAEGIKVVRPASGMAAALSPIVRAVGGTWVAHGAGSADRLVVDEKGRIEMPPEDPKFILRRVWLTRQEEKGYYYGLSNTALWPLCHTVYKRPFFSRSDWETYRSVNRKFADVVLEEAGSDPAIVFVQDYHLALLPRYVKSGNPDIKVIHFWHIPWPNPEAFRIFPWGEELLDGLLGNDLFGFHTQYHCNNFLQTVERTVEAMVDYEQFRIFRGGRPTYVRPFPISVNFEQIGRDVDTPTVGKRTEGFLQELGDISGLRLFVGADRIDYTKGILERLRAFDLLLQRHPELVAKVALVQLAAPSRTHVEAYRKLNDAMDELVDEINWRHQTEEWTPICFLRAHHDYFAVLSAYRMAHAVLVTSLHDGMNLVAKEFISSRVDGDGILLLSPYTGASRELGEAPLLVNPFDLDQMADAMFQAFHMPEDERRLRMERMRTQIGKNTVYGWGCRIFEELDRILAMDAPL